MFDEAPRIPTYLTIEAKVRELSAQGVGVYIVHRGEKMSGMLLLKVCNMAGQCKLVTQQRDLDGVLGWVDVYEESVIDEKKADDYISRSIDRDPDLWVIEVEHLEMQNFFIAD